MRQKTQPTSRRLVRAHAHNDYRNARPLTDAWTAGFGSIEVDIWWQAGELRVGHFAFTTEPGRTLESLYLNPLRDLVGQTGVQLEQDPVLLVVDLKSESREAFRELHRVLAQYPDLLTHWTDQRQQRRPVLVVISGNRPLADLLAVRPRFAAYDGRIGDPADAHLPSAVMPLTSGKWFDHFSWLGIGRMPRDERRRLAAIVADAHARGQRVRFYAHPDLPVVSWWLWRTLLRLGVDFLNTDHLRTMQAFNWCTRGSVGRRPLAFWARRG